MSLSAPYCIRNPLRISVPFDERTTLWRGVCLCSLEALLSLVYLATPVTQSRLVHLALEETLGCVVCPTGQETHAKLAYRTLIETL